jgi:predicted nucleic acid-binding protein
MCHVLGGEGLGVADQEMAGVLYNDVETPGFGEDGFDRVVRGHLRHPDEVDLDSVAVVLDTLALIDLTRGDLLTAGALPGQPRSHDAIHLAVALRIGADELLTDDAQLAHAAAAAGLPVAQPH